jgi:pimeloyl-ACP methyl ester carboxylesterase
MTADQDPDLPVEGFVDLDIPVERLWRIFSDVAGWPRWNQCFWRASVSGNKLKLGATLRWFFNPFKPWYLYKMPAKARVVEFEPFRIVTWEVTALPGFHARHSYTFESLGPRRSRFRSWETAEGPLYRLTRRFWVAHFRYVCRSSLAGARALPRGRLGTLRLIPFGSPTDAAPPLVAIPGIDGSAGSISPIVERLATSRQVLLVDYADETNPTLEGLTDQIADALEAKEIDLLGQSIGTILAAQLASRQVPGVRKVVLIGTFTRLRWGSLRLSNLLTSLSPPWLYRMTTRPTMAYVCGPVGNGWDHPFFTTARESNPYGIVRRTGWEIGRDFTRDLDVLSGPAIVLMGADDRFVPDVWRDIEKLRSLYRGRPIDVVPIPDAGHVLLPSPAIGRAVDEIQAFLG